MKRFRKRPCAIAVKCVCGLCAAAIATGSAYAVELSALRLGINSDLIMHLPVYVAAERKFFADENVAVERKTIYGKLPTSVNLVNKEVDVILHVAESYFELADAYGAENFKIIGGLTATEGSTVISRHPIPESGFKWNQLRGKRFLGRDKNSMPMYFLRSALVTNGVDPANVRIHTSAPVPARGRIWSNNPSYDFAVFFEPDASKFIRRGIGHFATMLGPAVGKIDFTVFIVRAAFLKNKTNRQLVQRFLNAIQRSLNAIAKARIETLVSIASRHSKDSVRGRSVPFDKADLADGLKRYKSIGLWKRDLRVAPRALTDLQRLIIEEGGTMTKKHRCYSDVVDMKYAEAALKKYPSGMPVKKMPLPSGSPGC